MSQPVLKDLLDQSDVLRYSDSYG